MKAGVLSDSHDRREAVAAALDLFRREGVGVIVHLGDVCAGATLDGWRDNGVPLIGVFGNCDGDRPSLQAATGEAFGPAPRTLEIAGRVVLMAHSFDELQGDIEERGRFDLILFGHTHRAVTMRIGRALVLNPGEACGSLTGRATVAVVDLAAMRAEIVEILPPGPAVETGAGEPSRRGGR